MTQTTGRTIVVTQGPASTAALIPSLRGQAGRWIAYDVRSERLLREAGLKYADLGQIVERPVLEDIDRIAHEWSRRWYRSIEPIGMDGAGARTEELYQRDFNYYFLGVLRATALARRLAQSEGPGAVFILARTIDHGGPSIRQGREESALPQLMARWSARTGATCRTIPSRAAASDRSGGPSWLTRAAAAALGSLRPVRSRYLFAGNSTLLGPVRDRLRSRGVSTAPVAWVGGARSLVAALRGGALPVPAPGRERGPVPGVEVREALRGSGLLVFEGDDLTDVVWPRIERYYLHHHLAAQNARARAISAIRACGAASVVVDEDVTVRNGLLVQAARSLALETTVVLHGPPIKPLGFYPMKSDRVLVWGERDRQVLMDWGLEESRIEITGCPRYDAYEGRGGQAERAAARARLGYGVNDRIALVAPANIPSNGLERFESLASNPHEYERYLRYFVSIAREEPDLRVILKFHAGAYDASMIKAQAPSLPANLRIVPGGPALPYLQAADLVFCGYSSLVFEAMRLDRAVVFTNFSEYPHPFGVEGAAPLYADSYESALEHCRRLQSGAIDPQEAASRQRALDARFFWRRDSSAADRVASRLLGEGRTHEQAGAVSVPFTQRLSL